MLTLPVYNVLPAGPQDLPRRFAVRETTQVTPPKPRLPDRVRTALRARHYSRRTEEAYVAWIKRYIFFFHAKRHPCRDGCPRGHPLPFLAGGRPDVHPVAWLAALERNHGGIGCGILPPISAGEIRPSERKGLGRKGGTTKTRDRSPVGIGDETSQALQDYAGQPIPWPNSSMRTA